MGMVAQVCLTTVALAQHRPDPVLDARYRQLEGYLCELQRPARIYAYSWSVGLGVVSVVQTSLALTVDAGSEGGRAARTGYLVGAGMSSLGMVLVSLTARPETNSCTVLREMTLSGVDPDRRLAEAERRLARAAVAARRQTEWWMHGVAGLLGLGVGLGLGFGYPDHVLRATLQGVGTVAFTELRIWTRPTSAIGLAQTMAL